MNKSNYAKKSEKKRLYDLPTKLQTQTDVPRELIKHFEEEGIKFRWLNKLQMANNHNVHRSGWKIWKCPDSLKLENVPLTPERTLVKGGDLVLGIQSEELYQERKLENQRKRKELDIQVQSKQEEFREFVAEKGIGHSVDTSYTGTDNE